VKKLGVEIQLETEVTPELVRTLAPDEVLVAAGAAREKPAILGVDREHVFDGDDLRALLTGQGDGSASKKLSLMGRLAVRAGRATGITGRPSLLREASKAWMPLGREVVVIGGGLVGLELAEFLAERGRRVVVLEAGPKLGLELAHPRRWRVLHELRALGVELVTNAVVRKIGEREVSYEIRTSPSEGRIASAPAESVILAVGLGANPSVAARLKEAGVPIREIGDVTGVGYLEGAIRDGFDAGIALG
jgi:2,4-dienoyl-CoA reductase (NADPH2)